MLGYLGGRHLQLGPGGAYGRSPTRSSNCQAMASQREKNSGELFFGIDARHIRQLGQELVGDRTTAVTELVKNAYDADATTVDLRFLRAGRKGGTLEVADNGNGMSLDDVRRGWMRISTNIKDVQQRSPHYGRT